MYNLSNYNFLHIKDNITQLYIGGPRQEPLDEQGGFGNDYKDRDTGKS